MESKSSSKWLWFFLGLSSFSLIVFILFFYISFKAFSGVSRSFSQLMHENTTQEDGPSFLTQKDALGVIELEGVIFDSKKTVEKLLKAEKDSHIKAIILRINSPGGAVGPSQEIYNEILRIDKESKPVYASFATVAASGGYYVGAACRKIYANAGTLTGSIGVIMEFPNLEKLAKKFDYKQEVLKSGKFKDAGSPFRTLLPEEREYFHQLLAGVHHQFYDDILKRRKDILKKDIKELGQGQIFSGQAAKEEGLVDKIGSLWELQRDIIKEMNLSPEIPLFYIKDKKSVDFSSLIDTFDSLQQLPSLFKDFFSQNKSLQFNAL